MQSSSGNHWIALDHVRALAAFCVFTWHFVHGANGYPLDLAGAPIVFPMAILDEGHTGVALFMTLSGYLFAKLLDGKSIDYNAFFWNRFLRLAPLLFLVIFFNAVVETVTGGGSGLLAYLKITAASLIVPFPRPISDNGIWSILVEVHFYLVLPLLLIASRHWKLALVICVASAVALRAILLASGGDIQQIAYWTIVGRIDQFLLGIIAFQNRHLMFKGHFAAGLIATAFCLFYYWFDARGGYAAAGLQPGATALWVVLPTFEAIAYAAIIAYYDGTYSPRSSGLSGLVAKAGTFSYSIYLLHFFIVFQAADFVHRDVMPISNFYVACLWSLLCFCLMVPVGWLSYNCIERPFLRLRRNYVRESAGEMSPQEDRRAGLQVTGDSGSRAILHTKS